MTTALRHLQSKLKLRHIVLLTLVWSHSQMRDEVVKNNLQSKIWYIYVWYSRPFCWRISGSSRFVNHLYMMSHKYKLILTGEFGMVPTVYDTVVCIWEPPVGLVFFSALQRHVWCRPRPQGES